MGVVNNDRGKIDGVDGYRGSVQRSTERSRVSIGGCVDLCASNFSAAFVPGSEGKGGSAVVVGIGDKADFVICIGTV